MNRAGPPLDGVRPGLVARFAGGDVRGDLRPGGIGAKVTAETSTSSRTAPSLGHGDRRVDVVDASAQRGQHRRGVGVVARLAEDAAVHDHDRVRAKHGLAPDADSAPACALPRARRRT